ncbi:carboxylating nicotinate-nucleotide diphosphorylase [Pelagibaculum spongiae]|uniref:nicotinate-nucleotide diphosphorylase (carboxylating) n=1 Tax=Pelagibaculum spongiae TaxID=2080658 RepID=A0A2V1H409_9GAMM|nr:carboxylating nicotinate-nucleotide diphosphorylase [Pelagibaculum spongiae]PVZ71958.1 carboxylating nicotinate-nucleotide diphosphorylase [Pelagibaculum spongiae]
MNRPDYLTQDLIDRDCRLALKEDLGQSAHKKLDPSADITAQLIDQNTQCTARVLCRDNAVISGIDWVESCLQQVDPTLSIEWLVKDGDQVSADSVLCNISGPARALLTAERPALNFLQTLSATATATAAYAKAIAHTSCRLLDTRKTLPGMRLAQKYAVLCGQGKNHRIGLWDAFLIKENHIMACGGIAQAIEKAKEIAPGKPVEVETENLDELQQALNAGADIIMLDNYSLDDMRSAVSINAGKAKLEASGNVDLLTIASIAETGVDFISVGAITKHVTAIDLSLRVQH